MSTQSADNQPQPWGLWSKLKFLFVAGGGLFGDGYLNTNIGLVIPIFGYLYWHDEHDNMPVTDGDVLKGLFIVGVMTGQMLLGFLGDALGRHRVYGKEVLFAIGGTLLFILLPWKGLSKAGIVAWLCAFRFVTGLGTGGDYPMTSALSAEHRPIGSRAKLVTLVFSFTTLGSLGAALVYLVLLVAFKLSTVGKLDRLEWVWRLFFGIGMIPACVTAYMRFKMKQSAAFTKYVATVRDTNKPKLQQQAKDFREYFSDRRHLRALVAAAGSWFFYDIASYGIGLNQSILLDKIGFSRGRSPWERLWRIAIGNLIVLFAGAIPGVYVGVFLPDLLGRRKTQLLSCLAASILFAIWAGVADTIASGGLITLFTLAQFFLSCGPSLTTFLYPVELFPARVRGTAHGIAAATGKAGALITAFSFAQAVEQIGLQGMLGLLAGLLFLVVLLTLLLPETKDVTLDCVEHDGLYGPTVVGEDESMTHVHEEVVSAKDIPGKD
ncbi:hypothetical protein M409DRAFT_30190 [Zasmidium cellare ATCC 36951]|uniref:Major facilitator superfamily (MFS) profile domain-containing protein n=1 Tax=Zasmidium cellare ATCC 36951 TaxID=1080233 RepID=A0A6A6BXI8_ZASCE|nr:uncharacterized protein M409DRAFT_30190 [Zasmidium cellare ATCC 36951]KAF2159313.1 hypothetical protein M409DRAFT_30190 [Zasmidium cellare ATCC 36951]